MSAWLACLTGDQRPVWARRPEANGWIRTATHAAGPVRECRGASDRHVRAGILHGANPCPLPDSLVCEEREQHGQPREKTSGETLGERHKCSMFQPGHDLRHRNTGRLLSPFRFALRMSRRTEAGSHRHSTSRVAACLKSRRKLSPNVANSILLGSPLP